MLLKEILDAGAASASNSPDDLVRRSILSAVLVRAGLLDDPAQALAAFRVWSHPHTFTPDQFVARVRSKVQSES
jgi:hypothetical protein